MQNASKVGFLVLIFVGLIFGAYQTLGRSLWGEKGYAIFAEFPDAAGVSPGAKVLLAGVKVGQVAEVKLTENSTARLKLEIRPGIAVPNGTIAEIPSSLIGIGESPLMLIPPKPGSSQATQGGTVAAGATLPGQRPSAFKNMFPEAEQTLIELNKTLEAARGFISNQQFQAELTRLVETSSATIEQFGKLAYSTNGIIAENRGAFKSAMASLSAAMRDVQRTTQMAAKLVADPELKNQASGLLEGINATTGKAQEMLSSVNNLINDPKLREPLANSMSNMEKISDSGTRIAANTEEITKNGISISKNVDDLTKKANELADKASRAMDKFERFFDKVPKATGIQNSIASMDLLRQSKPDYWRTDFNIKWPIKDGNAHFGIYDAFESNRISAQLGRKFDKRGEVRYGIYAGKPGVGVDYDLTGRFSLRGDLFDINDPQFNLKAKYDLGNGFLTWFGVDRTFGRNAPTIGIGIRK